MGLEQRIAPGTNPRIPRVVSKSDSDHGTATTAHRTLGLTPAGTIFRRNLSLSHYPICRAAQQYGLHARRKERKDIAPGYSLHSKGSKHRTCGEGVSRTSALYSNGRRQGAVSLFVRCRCLVLRLLNQYSFQFINNISIFLHATIER